MQLFLFFLPASLWASWSVFDFLSLSSYLSVFCHSFSNSHFFTDIPLHHQASNKLFRYINVLTSGATDGEEHRERRALRHVFTQHRLMLEPTVNRKDASLTSPLSGRRCHVYSTFFSAEPNDPSAERGAIQQCMFLIRQLWHQISSRWIHQSDSSFCPDGARHMAHPDGSEDPRKNSTTSAQLVKSDSGSFRHLPSTRKIK